MPQQVRMIRHCHAIKYYNDIADGISDGVAIVLRQVARKETKPEDERALGSDVDNLQIQDAQPVQPPQMPALPPIPAPELHPDTALVNLLHIDSGAHPSAASAEQPSFTEADLNDLFGDSAEGSCSSGRHSGRGSGEEFWEDLSEVVSTLGASGDSEGHGLKRNSASEHRSVASPTTPQDLQIGPASGSTAQLAHSQPHSPEPQRMFEEYGGLTCSPMIPSGGEPAAGAAPPLDGSPPPLPPPDSSSEDDALFGSGEVACSTPAAGAASSGMRSFTAGVADGLTITD